MAKAQSFGDKVRRQMVKGGGRTCPVCGELYSIMRRVDTVKFDEARYGFNQRMIKICKCTDNELLEA
ncbi:hypothetical protein ISS30_10770 [bacterium]|nr:hypothetical protein [bacterium]